MSEIVTLHHNEPMTTSLAIAACTENEHASVILLVRKYIDELEEFGEVNFQTAKPGNSRFEIAGAVFEIANCRNEKGRPTEFAFLNEQQSTFLVTLMRNSPIVVEFKKALVRAFFEMRDRVQGLQPRNPPFATSNLAHGADLAVAADRTFRSFLRAARSSGLSLPTALRIANRQTLSRTGMDMLAELDLDPEEVAPPPPRGAVSPVDELADQISAWLDDPARVNQPQFTGEEICLGLFSIGAEDRDYRSLLTRIGTAMARLGWRKRRSNGPGRPHFYQRP